MRPFAALVSGALLALTAPCAWLPQVPPSVRVENHSNAPYEGWIHATVPIAPGLVPDAQLLDSVILRDPVTQLPIPTLATPMKWHWQGGTRSSVALANVRAHVQLPPNSATEYPVRLGANPATSFHWGIDLLQWVSSQTIGNEVFLLARFTGDPAVYVARPPGQMRTLELNGANAVIRGRVRFRQTADESITHGMTLTSYWNLQAGENHGSVTFVVGNDTLERPVPGGIQIEELLLVHRLPFLALPKGRPTSGVQGPMTLGNYVAWELLTNHSLGDGQGYAADFAFCVATDPAAPQVSSMMAAAESPLIGIADAASWANSSAAGPIGFVPPPRFPDVATARAWLATSSALPPADPEDDLNLVNRNPPGTGDQPDFMSNIPVFYLQAIQTGSSYPLARAMVGAKRESWRPSYYWDYSRGYSERVSLLTYPDLFFWNGRPHYDPSWNSQYPIWLSRTAGFDAGNFAGWSGMDNQHFGHNAVRSVYELTADPYLAEVLKANMSVLYWDFFTDWMNSTEAERTGRLIKEAVMLYSLFPDEPESAALRNAIHRKLGVYVDTARFYYNLYHFPAIAAVRDDARVTLTQSFPGQDVHMSWQAGFHMEALALAWRILGDTNAQLLMQYYLDRAHLLFLPDGTPKSYTLMGNPAQYTTGGIGLAWWSGWVLADRSVAMHGNRALFDQFITPMIRQALIPANGDWWWSNDRWRCFL